MRIAVFFVYAGYVFVGDTDKEKREKDKYRKLCEDIKDVNEYPGELKACFLKNKHKRALVKVLSMYESISCSVDISRVHQTYYLKSYPVLDTKIILLRD